MPRVLVVDDEPNYREELELALSQTGHEVRTAANGREAIHLGARYRPDVLVTDWMLKNHLHGLHVAEALRTVRPDLQTILITGFGSRDLKSDAGRTRVFEYIEKPFDVDRIQQAVEKAGRASTTSADESIVGVVDVDDTGGIVNANAKARGLFARTPAGRNAKHLAELFSPDVLHAIDAASQRWIEASPTAPTSETWHLCSRPWPGGDGRLLVVIRDDERYQKHHPVVGMLLDLTGPSLVRWPLDGRVLVVDGNELVRRVVVAELDQADCVCHAADSLRVASRLLDLDADIQVVVLDYDSLPDDPGPAIDSLEALRPGVRIVGIGAEYRRSGFDAFGVMDFLAKPFVVDDLIDLLTGRIRRCVDCGLPIPLRRPWPGDVGSSWECCGCGARYFAVLEVHSPPDVLGNVRPADRIGPGAESPPDPAI